MRSKIRIENPKHLDEKLTKAIEYLKSIGCKEIILFGSLSDGRFDKFSDIDLAVSGISPGAYFRAVAVLYSIVGWKVDLVAMDYVSKDFAQRIRKRGKILYAA
jgi:predicted nucleotidyltransferase